MAQLPNLPRELRSTQVLVRFCMRIGILTALAAFSSIGFSSSLAALLWMAITFCGVIGLVKVFGLPVVFGFGNPLTPPRYGPRRVRP